MLFMVIERFRDKDMVPIYRQVRDGGRMLPEGLTARCPRPRPLPDSGPVPRLHRLPDTVRLPDGSIAANNAALVAAARRIIATSPRSW